MTDISSDSSPGEALEVARPLPVFNAQVRIVLPPEDAAVDMSTTNDVNDGESNNNSDSGAGRDNAQRLRRTQIKAGLARLSARADYLRKTRAPPLLWNIKPFEWPRVPPQDGTGRYAIARIENDTRFPVPPRQIEVYSLGLLEPHGHESLDAVQEVLERYKLRCVLDMAQYVQKLADEIVKGSRKRGEMWEKFQRGECTRNDCDQVDHHVAVLQSQLAECQGKAPEEFERQLRSQKPKGGARWSLEMLSKSSGMKK